MKIFREHPEKNNMTYGSHFLYAFSLCFLSFKAALFFLLHAFLPFIFEVSGSQEIKKIFDKIESRK